MHSIQGRSEHSPPIVHRSARRLRRRSSPGCCVDDFVVVVITNDPVFRVRVFLFAIFRFLNFLSCRTACYCAVRWAVHWSIWVLGMSSSTTVVMFACICNVLHCPCLYWYTCCDSTYARNRAHFLSSVPVCNYWVLLLILTCLSRQHLLLSSRFQWILSTPFSFWYRASVAARQILTSYTIRIRSLSLVLINLSESCDFSCQLVRLCRMSCDLSGV